MFGVFEGRVEVERVDEVFLRIVLVVRVFVFVLGGGYRRDRRVSGGEE